MTETLKAAARKVVPAPILNIRRRLLELDELERNLFVAQPKPTKQLFIRTAQRVLGYPAFVETGTFLGEMTENASRVFETVHTIELDEGLARRAKEKFAHTPHVHPHQGDSARVIREILPTVTTSCIFWLDAHYSGGFTARGDVDTPVLAELCAIREHPVRPHCILIDDARCFGTDPAYPTLEETFRVLREVDSQFKIGVSNDIIWAAREKPLNFEWQVMASGEVVAPSTK